MDQTSASASKPGLLYSAVNLDLPPPSPQKYFTCWYWTMVLLFLHVSVLISITHRISCLVHPRSLTSDRPKNHSHSHFTLSKRHDVEPRFASNQYYDESDESRISSSKPPPPPPPKKNMLTRVNIRLGLNTCHLLQTRISPLQPDTGLLSIWGSALWCYL